MTIKQQGGVFGRNPTFNDVEVDGTLTTDDFTLDGTPVTATGAELNYLDITTLGRGQASKAVTADASGNVFLGSKAFLSDVNAGHAFAQGGNAGLGYSARDGMIHSYNQLGSGGQTIRFLYQGSAAGYIDVYNTYATFRPSSGGGIDFSATAGTGTSELFDDYEEGTFTASLKVGGTTLYSTTTTRYTKVGRIVYYNIDFTNNSYPGVGANTGNVTVSGLPYAATNTVGRAVVSNVLQVSSPFTANLQDIGTNINATSSEITFYSTTGTTSSTLTHTALSASSSSSTYLRLSGVYTAA